MHNPKDISLLAKPTGVLWVDHRNNLLKECKCFFEKFPSVLKKCEMLSRNFNFSGLLNTACVWHDVGKLCPEWQKACQEDYKEYLATGRCNGMHLRKVPFRHEMDSILEFLKKKDKSEDISILVAIAAHHGRLSYQYEHRWRDKLEFLKIWNGFEKKSTDYRLYNDADFTSAIIERFKFDAVRALLRMFDHRASALEKHEIRVSLHTFNYEFPYPEKRGVQKIIEDLWDEPIALLRAPTGSGKTDASLLWAKHQIENGRASRIIFAMPTRFTANSLAVNVSESLSQTGLYHSTAFFQTVEHSKVFDEKVIDILNLSRNFNTPCTVTTIDHVCACICGLTEDQHVTYFNLANSCLVIDEADFYDEYTQANIAVLLEVLYTLKVPVLIMSATLPDIAKQIYSISNYTLKKIHEVLETGETLRTVKSMGQVEIPEDIASLLVAIFNEPVIIYANTVDRAQEYYKWFISNGYDTNNIVIYHSRFTEPHKAKKEKQLIEMLGIDAWKNSKASGIAILTQIGELSVNISSDLMISDLCPVDRLAQRIGRLVRFNKILKRNKKGILYLIEPIKTNKNGKCCFYPAPYGNYNIKEKMWEMTDTLKKTKTEFKDGDYSSADFIRIVNSVYENYNYRTETAILNAKTLRNLLVANWMILPKKLPDENENTIDWCSRNIPPQKTVFADIDFFSLKKMEMSLPTTWREYNRWKLKHGISIPSYLFEKMRKNSEIEVVNVVIEDDYDSAPVSMSIVVNEAYDFDQGLHSLNNLDLIC